MVLICIAGLCTCREYARIELISDYLSKNLPSFEVYKYAKKEREWNRFVTDMKRTKNIEIKTSPTIWRQLYQTGGKPLMFKSAKEYLNYVQDYYKIDKKFTNKYLDLIVNDNINECYELLARQMILNSVHNKWPRIAIFTKSLAQISIFLELISFDKTVKKYDIRISLLDQEDFDVLEDSVIGINIRRIIRCQDFEKITFDASYVLIFDCYFPENASNPTQEDFEARRRVYQKIGSSLKHSKDRCKILVSPSVTGVFSLNFDIFSLSEGIGAKDKGLLNRLYGVPKIYEKIASCCIGDYINTKPTNIESLCVIGHLHKNFRIIRDYCLIENASSNDLSMETPAGYKQNLKEIILWDDVCKNRIHDQFKIRIKNLKDFPIGLAMFEVFICFASRNVKKPKHLSLIQISQGGIIPSGIPFCYIYSFIDHFNLNLIPIEEYIQADSPFLQESIRSILEEFNKAQNFQ